MRKIYIEVGPLREHRWTGIPRVAQALSKRGIERTDLDIGFRFGDYEIPTWIIKKIINNPQYGKFLPYLSAKCRLLSNQEHSKTIFTNTKDCLLRGGLEYQIIHDLTTVFGRQYHTQDTIMYHNKNMAEEIQTNRISFCVSQHTKRHLELLFPEAKTSLFLLGSYHGVVNRNRPEKGSHSLELITLGTLEPRKNLQLIIEASRLINTEITWHIVGAQGWMENLDFQNTPKVKFIVHGYLTDQKLKKLLQSVDLLVYPSFYEGFGLPVAEAISLGVPAIASFSSSLVEVLGPNGYYFDPETPHELSRIIEKFSDVNFNIEMYFQRISEHFIKNFLFFKNIDSLLDAVSND